MFKELRCLNVHCEKKAFTTVPLHRASWFLSGGKKKEIATCPPPPVSPGQLLFLVNSWTAPG